MFHTDTNMTTQIIQESNINKILFKELNATITGGIFYFTEVNKKFTFVNYKHNKKFEESSFSPYIYYAIKNKTVH